MNPWPLILNINEVSPPQTLDKNHKVTINRQVTIPQNVHTAPTAAQTHIGELNVRPQLKIIPPFIILQLL